jgi:hypothetical protein
MSIIISKQLLKGIGAALVSAHEEAAAMFRRKRTPYIQVGPERYFRQHARFGRRSGSAARISLNRAKREFWSNKDAVGHQFYGDQSAGSLSHGSTKKVCNQEALFRRTVDFLVYDHRWHGFSIICEMLPLLYLGRERLTDRRLFDVGVGFPREAEFPLRIVMSIPAQNAKSPTSEAVSYISFAFEA